MKYTKAERLEIGRRIYEGELNKQFADEFFAVGTDCPAFLKVLSRMASTESRFKLWTAE